VTEALLELAPLAGGGTALTLTHGPYDESPGSQEMRAGHMEGWTHFLGRLHEVAEKGTE
jgi:Activator of Hsp90 ATPase homolog 1-like protein